MCASLASGSMYVEIGIKNIVDGNTEQARQLEAFKGK